MVWFWRILLLATVTLVIVPGIAVAQTIKVGSKNFTEQFIVAEIYAAALENAGFKVERKINLGGTLIAQKAIEVGEIDLYPEYTGTALVAVLKAPVTSDPAAVFEQVKAYYEKTFALTWLKPANINNGYAIIVRPDTAAKYHLKTLADLGAGPSKDLVMGAGPEFLDRQDGLPGLKAVYGVEFKEFKQFAKLGLRYDALAAKQIDVANGFATDWQIAEQKLVVLDDSKTLFPPYYLAPVIRIPTLQANPKIATILEPVDAALDNTTMRDLNAKVERDKDEPKEVAVAFLRSKGLIK
ncbi:MAG: ABC transporter [Pseudomonadota bacterium]|nr:ABC transporter [Pseudomonadota bacterium]